MRFKVVITGLKLEDLVLIGTFKIIASPYL